jgi:hypothetical protein
MGRICPEWVLEFSGLIAEGIGEILQVHEFPNRFPGTILSRAIDTIRYCAFLLAHLL